MIIHILSVSDSDKHFQSAVQEYCKRLWNTVRLDNIKPSKNGSNLQIIQKDTENMIGVLSKKYSDFYKILLSKDWDMPDTMQFVDLVQKNLKIVFVIWWAYGLDETKINNFVDKKICFGKMTLQHGLVKLILLEQIYRVFMINSGRNYHY